jgi:hypothetical protein
MRIRSGSPPNPLASAIIYSTAATISTTATIVVPLPMLATAIMRYTRTLSFLPLTRVRSPCITAHDPNKCVAVFRKDHAQTINWSRGASNGDSSIATVSLSSTLEEKLRVIAAANFDAVEIFENDLLALTAGRGMLHRAARRPMSAFGGIWVTCGRRPGKNFLTFFCSIGRCGPGEVPLLKL